MSKNAFLVWWRKQALSYRKRAQIVRIGLADGIKRFRRGSLAQQRENLRRSSLMTVGSLQKRPPRYHVSQELGALKEHVDGDKDEDSDKDNGKEYELATTTK